MGRASFGPVTTQKQVGASTTTSFDFTAPPQSAGGVLCVGVMTNGTSQVASSVSFGGRPLTNAGAASDGANTTFAALFVLTTPQEGQDTILVTLGSSGSNWLVLAFMLYGLDLTAPTDLAVTAGSASATTITADHSNAGEQKVLDIVAHNNGAVTMTGGQTEIANDVSSNNNVWGAVSIKAGDADGSTTMSYSGASGRWALVTVALREAAVAGRPLAA